MSAGVTIDVEEGVAIVTLDTPPVNAMNRSTLAAIATTFGEMRYRRDVRVAILTGAGDRAFSAGTDIKRDRDLERAELLAGPPDALIEPERLPREALSSVLHCAVPVIAAVNGPAIGAGAAFASVCDFIIAADTAYFQLTEIDVGLLGAGRHMQRLVGPYKARKMYFTGERVSAGELYRLGAVEQLVALPDLLPSARQVGQIIAEKSPIAMRLAKRSLDHVEHLPLEVGYEFEQQMTVRLSEFEDATEARHAAAERRKPRFHWR